MAAMTNFAHLRGATMCELRSSRTRRIMDEQSINQWIERSVSKNGAGRARKLPKLRALAKSGASSANHSLVVVCCFDLPLHRRRDNVTASRAPVSLRSAAQQQPVSGHSSYSRIWLISHCVDASCSTWTAIFPKSERRRREVILLSGSTRIELWTSFASMNWVEPANGHERSKDVTGSGWTSVSRALCLLSNHGKRLHLVRVLLPTQQPLFRILVQHFIISIWSRSI